MTVVLSSPAFQKGREYHPSTPARTRTSLQRWNGTAFPKAPNLWSSLWMTRMPPAAFSPIGCYSIYRLTNVGWRRMFHRCSSSPTAAFTVQTTSAESATAAPARQRAICTTTALPFMPWISVLTWLPVHPRIRFWTPSGAISWIKDISTASISARLIHTPHLPKRRAQTLNGWLKRRGLFPLFCPGFFLFRLIFCLWLVF